jgi:hypothetical protein
MGQKCTYFGIRQFHVIRHWNVLSQHLPPQDPYRCLFKFLQRTLLPGNLQFVIMDYLASPAEGLEDMKSLPFNNTAKFEKAIAERLQAIEDGENVREWSVFSDFDSSKLKLIDKLQRRYPIRLQLDGNADGNALVVKMVHPVHEAVHDNLMSRIERKMWDIGLEVRSITHILDQAGTIIIQETHSKKRTLQ